MNDAKPKKNEKWKHFDDCAICRAMKKADEDGRDLTRNELEIAFKEANKKRQ